VDGNGQIGRTLLSLSRAAARDRLNVFHSPGYFLPLWPGPKVVTFHDVNMFLQWDKWWRTGKRLSWLSLCGQTLLASRLARKVLAVSETAAGQIRRLLRLPACRVLTLYQGIDDRFFQPADLAEAARLREAHGLHKYLLFVGVLAPQKNLEGLIQACAALDQPELELAIVGREYGPYFREVVRPLISRLGMEHRVAMLGTVPSEALPGLYAGAKALIYPSFAEGFGLPPLEAMACGTPVVASDRPSLPEVLGDAALLVDPSEPFAIAEGIERILTDPALADELRRRGRERAGRFRWSTAAARALEIYASVA
jgi:glycosyltransferase involved in cell wall biosynthesis